MHIKATQISLLNEVVNNRQISDVFITHENQIVPLENLRKCWKHYISVKNMVLLYH